jgi:hypothetical protein
MDTKMLTELMGIRFDPDTFVLIQKVAVAQGIGACDFVRLSVGRELARLQFLFNEEKKALEVAE